MKMKHVSEGKPVENPAGIVRKTLAYNDEAMLCHFDLKQGAEIPLHDHRATQIGYIIRGRVRMLSEDPAKEVDAGAGDTYVFGPHEKDGTRVLEDAEYIEVFTPSRAEHKDC